MLGDEFYDDQEAQPAPAGGVTVGGHMGLLLILVALIVPVLLLLRPPPRHPAVVPWWPVPKASPASISMAISPPRAVPRLCDP